MAQARYTPLSASGLFCGPSNTLGIANPMPPQAEMEETTGIGDSGKDFEEQEPGSGDTF
jgi:hypothetical protein